MCLDNSEHQGLKLVIETTQWEMANFAKWVKKCNCHFVKEIASALIIFGVDIFSDVDVKTPELVQLMTL